MIQRLQRFSGFLKSLTIGHHAWSGASAALLIFSSLFILTAAYNRIFLTGPGLGVFLAVLKQIGYLLLFSTGVLLTVRLIRHLPALFTLILVATLAVLDFHFGRGEWEAQLLMIGGVSAAVAIFGAGIAVLIRGGREATGIQRLVAMSGSFIGAIALLVGGYLFLRAGHDVPEPKNAALLSKADVSEIKLSDPSLPGDLAVLTVTYGSGKDRHRAAYAQETDIITKPVDGSLMVEGWDRNTGWARTQYWGFGPEALPIQGRVWYPDGDGPFPLVLMVHGNHSMEEFSDSGYAYMGKLLASRGIILVSVDQNFLNSSFSSRLDDGRRPWTMELDARGWLLLEHLKVWDTWNNQPDNPFFGRVDMDRIALMGHSRGGEAVAIAAMFNRFTHYPDDASLTFDYQFNIRGVVAIAPVDRYLPAGLWTTVPDVNYLVLHGSHDADVQSFRGSRQFERVSFSGEQYNFKAGLYIYGANHGQFNSVWGRADTSFPGKNLLNLRDIMPGKDQRKIGKVFMSAFLEICLRDKRGYLPLFRDYRAGREWLPETVYLNHFEDTTYEYLATYDEDIDVTTGTYPGTVTSGENLTRWLERRVALKQNDKATNAVYLGWDNESTADTASYTIKIPPDAFTLGNNHNLVFTLADAKEKPDPKHKESEGAPTDPMDLTVEVTDSTGRWSRIPLSRFSLLQPQLVVQVRKADMFSTLKKSEPVYQGFEFPLSDFVESNPNLDIGSLLGVRFVFDRSPRGVVILDNVGFRKRLDNETS